MQTPTNEIQQVKATPIVGGRPPKRNEPCPCGSELKFKHCHGDPIKVQQVREMANAYANKIMFGMIRMERMRKGVEPHPFTCTACGKGCITPKESVITPGALLCPECDGVVEETVVRYDDGENETS